MKYNFLNDFYTYPGFLRFFAMNDEQGLIIGTYPRGGRPERPFHRFSELWTGLEYTAAVHMLYEGQIRSGLKCIKAVRDRYDGRKRNPFDEAECGHHYARAMASWAAMPALSGFRYSAVEQTMTFAAADTPVRWFWSNGAAWGICRQTPGEKHVTVNLQVRYGTLKLCRFTLAGVGSKTFDRVRTIRRGEDVKMGIARG